VGLPMRCRSPLRGRWANGADQRLCPAIIPAGATATGKYCPTGTILATSETGFDHDVSVSRRNRAATTRAQPQRVGGTRTAWARTPAGHARGIDVTRESNAPTGAPSFETRALTLAAPRRIHQASELGRCYAERLARHKHSALRICSTAQEGRRVA
jgi:hypothetical protein